MHEFIRTDVDVLLFLGRRPLPGTNTAELCAARRSPRPGAGHHPVPSPTPRPSPSASLCALAARLTPCGPPAPTLGGANGSVPRCSSRLLTTFYAQAVSNRIRSWRALDAGWIDYRSDMLHPSGPPPRSIYQAGLPPLVARNRVWLARRNLPAPVSSPSIWRLAASRWARRPSKPHFACWSGGSGS